MPRKCSTRVCCSVAGAAAEPLLTAPLQADAGAAEDIMDEGCASGSDSGEQPFACICSILN